VSQISEVLRLKDFNPHTREGCDGILFPLENGRRNFNPHTREGCDYTSVLSQRRFPISIHTPARGVTASMA